MPSLGEASISLVQSALPPSTMTSFTIGTLILALSAVLIHYTSPTRLTAALVAALHETEEAHFGAVEGGLLSASEAYTETLSNLQIRVSIIREASLCNSLSHSQALRGLLQGHTHTVLQCMWEVQGLKTHIEILKERQMRHLGLLGTGSPTRTVAFRRRYSDTNSFKCCKCW
ncbi:hypothetical protein DFH09DRAFT_381054 [Mycena vulgaris]|nr:hypothetical protein DFH09DRAFT_381054 [Mycena vulgaris]